MIWEIFRKNSYPVQQFGWFSKFDCNCIVTDSVKDDIFLLIRNKRICFYYNQMMDFDALFIIKSCKFGSSWANMRSSHVATFIAELFAKFGVLNYIFYVGSCLKVLVVRRYMNYYTLRLQRKFRFDATLIFAHGIRICICPWLECSSFLNWYFFDFWCSVVNFIYIFFTFYLIN